MLRNNNSLTLNKKELEELIASFLAEIAKAKAHGGSKEEINHYEKELRLLEMAYDDTRRR